MSVRLRDVVALLDEWYDPAWAEDWDAVGLVCGDPEAPVQRILFAVDPAPAVVEEAKAYDADLVVVHHPLLLTAVHGVAATTPKGRTVHELVRNDIALFAAHTNADVPPSGVNESLALAVGVVDPQVIVPTDDDGVDKLVVFVPQDQAEQVREAIVAAGAGTVGAYDSCTFTTTGEGRFRPLEGAEPTIGRVGEVEVVAEARVESVFPRRLRRRVVAAMRAAHPYEEVAYDVLELAGAGDQRPATRGHGRVGRLAAPTTLRAFADRVGAALPECAHGVRVAGDPDRVVETVAVASGAGDYLLDTMLGVDADVFVTSDLRHHRAGEFLEHGRAALIDVAHWAAEWTWLPVVRRRVVEALATLGDTVDTHVSETVTDPWTFRI
ncbi:MAG: Nif3-like dinuclear metal center hexameric protein [Nocardioidaceae bacterium]